MKTLADLMEPCPRPWGLRGDPLLWEAMKQIFADQPVPATEDMLRRAFHSAFEALTDQDLEAAPDFIPVPWTKQKTGMSRGLVSREYWRNRMLPALIDRFHSRDDVKP